MDRRLLTPASGMFALETDSSIFGGVLPQLSRFFQVSIGAAGQMIPVCAIMFALRAPAIAALAAGICRKRLLSGDMGMLANASLGNCDRIEPSPRRRRSRDVLAHRQRRGYHARHARTLCSLCLSSSPA